MIMVLLARFVNPNDFVWLAFVVLAAPLIYLGNIILFLIWVIRWKSWALITAIPLSIGMTTIGQFYQLQTAVDYDDLETPSSKEISIMSYNVYAFDRYAKSGSTIDSLLNDVQQVSPDIVCFQEFFIKDSADLITIDSKMSDYPFREFQLSEDENPIKQTRTALFSKFPIIRSEIKTYSPANNGHIIADIALKDDTVRVINCHLQTTNFNGISKNRSITELWNADSTEHVAEKIVDTFKDNFKERAFQADSLRMIIDSSEYPVFIAGDFNSPPMTYTYYNIASNLSDAFCCSGVGYGNTFRPMKGLLRIDYLLFDSQYYESLSYDSYDWRYSDHRPITARFLKTE